MKRESSAAIAVQDKRRERRYATNDPAEVRVTPFTAAPVPANWSMYPGQA